LRIYADWGWPDATSLTSTTLPYAFFAL